MIKVYRDSCQHSTSEVVMLKPWIPTAFFIVVKLLSYPLVVIYLRLSWKMLESLICQYLSALCYKHIHTYT